MLNDGEEVPEFEENTVIEHKELIYIEHEFITDVLDYELTYDEDDAFAEIFEGKLYVPNRILCFWGHLSSTPTNDFDGESIIT